MASGPITSWEIDGETVETVADFIFLGSKITADGDCGHEIKRRLLLGRKAMTNIDSMLKSRSLHTFHRLRLRTGAKSILHLIGHTWSQDCWEKYQSPQKCRWHQPYGRKWRGTKEALDESERREWKSWLKTQHSKNKDHGIQSHHFMTNRWGNNGNSKRDSLSKFDYKYEQCKNIIMTG